MSDYSFIKNGFIRYQIWYPYYSIFDEEKMTFDQEKIKAASQTAVVSGGRYEH